MSVHENEPMIGKETAATATEGSTEGTALGQAPADEVERHRIRVGTVVWGLVVAAVGVGLIALAGGVTFDVELSLIALIAAAGVALLTGSLVGSLRRRRR